MNRTEFITASREGASSDRPRSEVIRWQFPHCDVHEQGVSRRILELLPAETERPDWYSLLSLIQEGVRSEYDRFQDDYISEQLSSLQGKVEELSEVVHDLSQRLEEVEGWVTPLPEDPIGVWYSQNLDLLDELKGHHVAIHPEKGLVASDLSYEEVHERVEAEGILDEVIFDYIPEF